MNAKKLIDEINRIIANDNDDEIDEIEYLIDDLSKCKFIKYYRNEINAICDKLELCKMHFCDIQNCIDDDIDECAKLRNE